MVASVVSIASPYADLIECANEKPCLAHGNSPTYMQAIMHKRFFTAFALFLSACTGMGQDGRGYPSLAKRPVESARVGGEVPNDVQDQGTETPAAPADSDLMQQLATLSSQADKGKTAFDALYPTAADHVHAAAGAAVSSEAWVVAHVDLSALEQARYDSVYALASLDTLYAERAKALAEGKVQGGVTEILAARKAALAVVDAQNDRVDQLRAALTTP
jgi:hypothetical protein